MTAANDACKHGVLMFEHCSRCAEEMMRQPTVHVIPVALENTLQQRHERYGTYLETAQIIQDLKDVMRATPKWNDLEADQKESLELIANKLGRILRGDANYADSWHDIAGYATLIEKRLNGEPL
jgi:hypothetical protein